MLGSGNTVRSLRIRNFRLFFFGQLISQVGNWLTLIAQSLLVLHLTDNSGVAVGVLTACQFLPVLVLGAWAGLVVDRADKRRLLIAIQAFAMAQSFVLAALAFSGDPPLVAIYAVAMAGGVATAFDSPARRTIVSEMVPDEEIQNAVGLNSALMTGSRVVGPALAGLLIAGTNYGWCFLIDGLSYLAVLYGLWRVRSSELRRADRPAPAKRQIRAGLKYVRSERELFVPIVMMAIIGTFAANTAIVVPLFVKRSLGGSDAAFTALFSIISVGSLAAALVSAKRVDVRRAHVVNGAALLGVGMFVMSVMPNLWSALLAALLVGFGSLSFMTTANAIVQLRAEPSMRGRVLALQSMVFLGSTPIGGPLIGWVCDAFGARWGFVVGAIACVVAAVWGHRALAVAPASTPTPTPAEPVAVEPA